MSHERKKTKVGKVIGDKMDKTVVVQVMRKIPRPVYQKFVKRFKKYFAHVESVKPKVGDIVEISSMRPMSKRKRWRVKEIIRESIKIG